MPTPPATIKAPVCVLVLVVVSTKIMLPVLNVPYVALVNVLVLSSMPDLYHSR